MKTVLITGAAGDVGSHLRRNWREHASAFRQEEPEAAKDEEFIRADISKFADAMKITKGVDAIVHLGGYSVEGPGKRSTRRTSSAATTSSRPRAGTR